jgi:ribosomal protein L9
MGEVVTVKDGYARNYLIPQQLAYYASPKAVEKIEEEKETYMQQKAEEKSAAEMLGQKFEDLQVTIAMKVGEEGKLFGSVTTQMISDELKLQGYTIDKKDITIPDSIRTLGVFQTKVKLHTEVTAPLKVWVIAEE